MIESLMVALFILLIFGVIVFFIYLPVIINHFRLKRLKKELDESIQNLDFSNSLIIETKPLGLGGLEVEAGNVSFADVQKHQELATKSILALMKKNSCFYT